MRRQLLRYLLWPLGVAFAAFAVLVVVAYAKQDELVQHALAEINQDMVGRVSVGGSHIAPFEAFPLVCIDLEDVRFHADDDTAQRAIYAIDDLYLCFRVWDLIRGYLDVRSVHAVGGHLDLVLYQDGSLNLLLAKQFNTGSDSTDESGLHIHLRDLLVRDFTFTHRQEGSDQQVTARIAELKADFRVVGDSVASEVAADLRLDIIGKRDTSFFFDKHIELDAHLDYDMAAQVLKMPLGSLKLQEVEFNAEGSIDISHEVDLDLHIHGEKPDFTLLTAFAPNDVAAFLAQFKNAGSIVFDGTVKGRSALGMTPRVDIAFSCADGWFENPKTAKRVDGLAFRGHFTNGGDPKLHKAELHIRDLALRPGTGVFKGDLIVKDFVNPYIDVDLHSDLDLDFVGKFLNVEVLKELGGHVEVDMKLTELIDIETPERNLARLKQGVDSELRVRDLHVRIPGHPHAIDDLDIHAQMRKGFLEIDTFSLRMASSDLRLSGSISDVPAIFHHHEKPIELKLALNSRSLKLHELLAYDTALARSQTEELNQLSAHLHFATTVSGLLDHQPLPIGSGWWSSRPLTVVAKCRCALSWFSSSVWLRANAVSYASSSCSFSERLFSASFNSMGFSWWWKMAGTSLMLPLKRRSLLAMRRLKVSISRKPFRICAWMSRSSIACGWPGMRTCRSRTRSSLSTPCFKRARLRSGVSMSISSVSFMSTSTCPPSSLSTSTFRNLPTKSRSRSLCRSTSM
ncbi:MAG TPA: hypothetical protein PLR96_03770 [Flavobacteriales bacterium]|nr:hypothetical protein [Flavobacteriales bacterium]